MALQEVACFSQKEAGANFLDVVKLVELLVPAL